VRRPLSRALELELADPVPHGAVEMGLPHGSIQRELAKRIGLRVDREAEPMGRVPHGHGLKPGARVELAAPDGPDAFSDQRSRWSAKAA